VSIFVYNNLFINTSPNKLPNQDKKKYFIFHKEKYNLIKSFDSEFSLILHVLSYNKKIIFNAIISLNYMLLTH